MLASSSSEHMTEQMISSSDDESIYKSVSSGLGEKIDEEVERL